MFISSVAPRLSSYRWLRSYVVWPQAWVNPESRRLTRFPGLEQDSNMHMYGIPIPTDWMLTADGKPTGDPDEGRMLAPAAGPKGYGLALIMGILAGPLVGGLMGCHRAGGASEHFFMALDISSFTDFDEYAAELDRGIRTVKASKTVEGVDEVYLPGEIEWRNYEMWIENGLPLHHDHLEGLAAIAGKLGVATFW